LSKIQNPISNVREVTEHVTQVWAEKGATLTEPNDFSHTPHAEHVKVMKTLGQALQRLVTPEVLSDFAVTAVAANDIAEVGDELDPFDPLH
jgi:hypothetical protein